MTILTDAVWVWADAAIEDLVTACVVALTDDATVSEISGIVEDCSLEQATTHSTKTIITTSRTVFGSFIHYPCVRVLPDGVYVIGVLR